MNKSDNYITLVLLHIAIGILLSLFEPLSKLYFIIVVVYFLGRIVLASQSTKTREVLLACAYLSGVEVLFRMTDGAISWEASKYLVIVFIVMGMFYKGLSGKGYPYFFYLIVLVPAVLVASNTLSLDARFRTNIAFVLSGPVCLGVAALFCYDRKVTKKELLDIITYLALPTIAMTAFLFLYNPSIKDVLSGTDSNSAASGGFGPNQVSTALGLGMFAIIVVAAFLWTIFYRSSAKQRNQIIGLFILFVISIAITWTISSNQTRGLIDKRYANQDALGRDKQDLTTGRLDLFMEEIDGFLSSPFLGIGASRVKDIRVESAGKQLPSHNEIGRLLSEHGFLGILILLILLIKPLAYIQ